MRPDGLAAMDVPWGVRAVDEGFAPRAPVQETIDVAAARVIKGAIA